MGCLPGVPKVCMEAMFTTSTTPNRHLRSQKLYIYAVGLLLCHRITQRWNQTGQKFAGAPDIVHDVMMPYPFLLWTLVTATYSILLYRIGNHVSYHLKAGVTVGTACAMMLCIPAFAFKLGFAARDAPELLSWLGPGAISFLEQLPLVGSARLIFLTIGSEILWAICSRFSYAKEEQIPRKGKHRQDGGVSHHTTNSHQI